MRMWRRSGSPLTLGDTKSTAKKAQLIHSHDFISIMKPLEELEKFGGGGGGVVWRSSSMKLLQLRGIDVVSSDALLSVKRRSFVRSDFSL